MSRKKKLRFRQHSGDCTIYRLMMNGRPADGICTCGYGWQLVRRGDYSEMYSDERLYNMRLMKEVMRDVEKLP